MEGYEDVADATLFGDPELLKWFDLYAVLRFAAQLRQQHAARGDLDLETFTPLLNPIAELFPDADLRETTGKDVYDWLASALTELDADLPRPIPEGRQDDEAILCWKLHVVDGLPIKTLGTRISASRYLDRPWRAPDKTVRERMWAVRRIAPRNVTQQSSAGLRRIVKQVELVIGSEMRPTRTVVCDPGPSIVSSVETRPIPGDASDFVADITVPDGEPMDRGEEFEKVWEIRNVGDVPWVGRYLERSGGLPGPGGHVSPRRVQIRDTQPGESVQIRIAMRAPAVPGSSISMWKMTDKTGRLYFPDRYKYGLICQIQTLGTH